VNSDGSGFSYSLTSPTLYNGSLLSYSDTGTITGSTFTFLGSGTFGATSFTTNGAGTIAAGPSGSTIITFDDNLLVAAALAFDTDYDFILRKNGTSTDTGYDTDKNGNKIPKSDFTSTDTWTKDPNTGKIKIKGNRIPDYPPPMQPMPRPVIVDNVTSPISGGSGTLSATISTVPEPSTLTLATVAAFIGLAHLRPGRTRKVE
jgi:hypothetical protein